MKYKHIDIVTIKVLTLSLIGLAAMPYWFYTGGTILGFILVRIVAKFLQTCGSIGYHRWLCHNSFVPSTVGKYLMLTGIILNSVGSPLHYVVAHRQHHAHADACVCLCVCACGVCVWCSIRAKGKALLNKQIALDRLKRGCHMSVCLCVMLGFIQS